jgi:hypothetical protein
VEGGETGEAVMAENTKISWADHTFNPWIGCSRVHAGCVNCYAEAMAGRLNVHWGPNGTRRRTAESTWKQVEKWNRKAACKCRELATDTMTVQAELHLLGCPQADRPRVFPSLCDPFEDWMDLVAAPDQTEWRMQKVRNDFFLLIDRNQNLDWLLLTKRPGNVPAMWPRIDRPIVGLFDEPPPLYRENAWLLYSASDQSSLESGLPHLLACRDLVPVLGLSLEPLIGPVDLPFRSDGKIMCDKCCWGDRCDDPSHFYRPNCPHCEGSGSLGEIDWVIVGGESGPNARRCNVEWIRSIVRQCQEAGVPCFVKQVGAKPIFSIHDGIGRWNAEISHPKGGDPSEWPEDVRVQQFPIFK